MLQKSEIFYTEKPVYVLKPFKAFGRQLTTGELFNWQRHSMTKRRVAQMFFTRQLSHGGVLPESVKEYLPAAALLDLGYSTEDATKFSKEQVKAINATAHKDELISILASFQVEKPKAKAGARGRK